MPLKIQTGREIADGLRQDLRSEVPGLNPSTQRRGFISGLVIALSSALRDWYVAVKRYVERHNFPQVAPEDRLETAWWNPIAGVERFPATSSTGSIVITGDRDAILPAEAALVSNSLRYVTRETVAIELVTVPADRIEYVPGIGARFTSTDPHGFATGQTVAISSAPHAAYNIEAVITVTSTFSFTYPLLAEPSVIYSEATLAEASADMATVVVDAEDVGAITNQSSGTLMEIQSVPSGIDTAARVGFSGLTGGDDREPVESFRDRVLEGLAIDYGQFTEDEIIKTAKSVPGVSRVWVVRAARYPDEGQPGEGQVKIVFMRDGDPDPFPGEHEVAAVKAKIVSEIMPAHTVEEDVWVSSPTPVDVDFTFTALEPNTLSMRAAVRQRLSEFFALADFEADIDEDDYRCAIREAYDAERGERLRRFQVDRSGPVIVGDGGLARLGAVEFAI